MLNLDRNFKVALFDLDGTVIDTESQYSIFWGRVGQKYHPEIKNFEQVIKGTTLVQIFDKYFPDEELQTILTAELDKWEEQMDYQYVPGAKEYIEFLRSKGIKCAVVTSSNEKKLASLKKARPEISGMFDKILTAEMFAASKPDPDCYLLGAKVFGVVPDDCVVFEDALTGIEAGMRAGMFTVGLATTNPREKIEPLCSMVVNDFR